MTRPTDAVVVCQAASILLQYPDQTVRDRVPLVTAAVQALPRDGRGRRCPPSSSTSARTPPERWPSTTSRRSTGGAGAAST